jgi:regulation of enolase protein 1 (concanavalin A-like superfamily)
VDGIADAVMPLPLSRRAILILLNLIAISTASAFAQTTPPRPAVSLQRFPSISGIPVDVDGDGRPDLIGQSLSGLVVARGNGDGTFGQPRTLNRQTYPLAVADFNGDTYADIVTAEIAILPGRGDGTFGAARTIASGVELNRELITPRVIAADLNADGRRDLVIADRGVIVVYPGNGDLTFDPRIELPPAGDGAREIFASDVNHDGRLDIVASTFGGTIEVFLNTGGFIFAVNSTPAPFDQQDVIATDLNGDNAPDLIVAASSWGLEFTEGRILVMLGHGDGTFGAPATYETGVRGAVVLAAGDFNADGRPDVATGNRSWRYLDTPCTGAVYWDSVTIFPGLGTGSLGLPATFRLGSSNSFDEPYRNTISALWPADMNGDGRTDLVTAPAAVLLSRAATANRPPQVTAGPDQTQESGNEIRFDPLASDADFDWLDFQWQDDAGRWNLAYPHFCASADPGQYTVTVDDRRGGTASDSFVVYPLNPEGTFLQLAGITNTVGTQSPYTVHWSATGLTGATSLRLLSSSNDGQSFSPVSGCTALPITATECVWTSPGPVTSTARLRIEALNASGAVLYFDPSERFSIVNAPSISLPIGWAAADIGAVGARGYSTADGTTFTVRGSGADIWNTADEFHWAFTHVTGDASIVARVTSVQNVNAWTKAGVMIREGLFTSAAGARHASMFVTPSTVKGTAFQRRVTAGGSSISTAGPAATAPVWVKLSRTGNTITAYTRPDGALQWTQVGSQTYGDLPQTLQMGVAVSSHVDGTLATATFDHVEVQLDPIAPPEWSEEDIGNVSAEGSAAFPGGSGTVTGSGADIWGTADEFHWMFRRASGDFSIQTFVESVQNVNVWTKAGLMIRASSAAGAQHASLFATPSAAKGIAFQTRLATNGSSVQVAQAFVAPSVWLRLTRRGSVIRAYFRKAQTDPWQNLGSVTLDGLPSTVEVGFAVSSHVDGTLATAAFQSLDVERILQWTTTRIGPGESDSFVDGTFFSVNNTGADVWGTSDAFTYVWTRWSGDGAITARLNTLDRAHDWTKGGVMFRESLAADSKHAFALASAMRGLALQYRSSSGGSSAGAGTMSGAAPVWIKLAREGDNFTMYVLNGQSGWETVGRVVIAMPADIYVGLAVTSHNTGADAWGLFDDVSVRPYAFGGPGPVPTGQ